MVGGGGAGTTGPGAKAIMQAASSWETRMGSGMLRASRSAVSRTVGARVGRIAPNRGAATCASAIRLKRATRASAIRRFGPYRAVTPIHPLQWALLTPAGPACAELRYPQASSISHEFNRMQIRKFGRDSDKKAWLLLDNSSTHVLPDGATDCLWEVDGFKLRGFKRSHTNAVFALANTTSETQAMDAGIIANVKAKTRTKF